MHAHLARSIIIHGDLGSSVGGILMLRGLSAALATVVVALSLFVASPPKSAHAFAACKPSDWVDSWYWDSQTVVSHDVSDVGVGVMHIHFSIDAYRYSDDYGNCWRHYIWEAWIDNPPAELATIIIGGPVWACGNYVGTYWVGVSGAATGAWQSPDINYGPTACGNQVTNFRSYMTPYSGQTWNIWPDTYTNVTPNWHAHIG